MGARWNGGGELLNNIIGFTHSLAGLVTAITTIVAGALAIVALARRVIKEGREWHGLSGLVRELPKFLASMSVFLLLIGLVLLPIRWITDPCQEKTNVQISNPLPNAQVEIDESVAGIFNCIRRDQYLWLFIQPKGTGTYYPQPDTALSRSDGRWSVEANFGIFGPADPPTKSRHFIMFAVIGNESANLAFEDYLTRSRDDPSEGMDSFTRFGATEYAKVEVIAKQPSGSITNPRSGQSIPGSPETYEVRGTLSNIPSGYHVLLTIQNDKLLLPKEEISPSEQQWTRTLRQNDTPLGNEFSIVLLMTGPKGQKEIEGFRRTNKPLESITGSFSLATVHDLVATAPACTTSPLNCLFSQPKPDGGIAFVYTEHGGRLRADLTDARDCRRGSRSIGLRVTYNMSGEGFGGWGVHWAEAPSGHFDVREFTRVVVSVRGARGQETFQLGLKDTSGLEVTIESADKLIVSGSKWQRLEVPLKAFSGVNRASIENVNIGFNRDHRRGQLCIDEIAFV